MRMLAPRWALLAPAAALLALLASVLLSAPRASAETPTATPTPTATVTTEASATTTFEITPEGLEQLQKLVGLRWLPRHTRVALAAVLERAGVEHERLVELLQQGRKHVEACERALDAGADVEERCRAKLEGGDRTQLCERVLAATEVRENLVERCREFLEGNDVDWRQLCARVAAATEAPERLIEKCRHLQQRLAAAATATPAAGKNERRAALQEAMSAFWACVRENAEPDEEGEHEDANLEGVRAECAAEVQADFGIVLDLGLPAFKASPEGEKRGLRGMRLDGASATSDLRGRVNIKQGGDQD